MRIRVRILEDINENLTEGMEKNLQPNVATDLIKRGKAEKIGEVASAPSKNSAKVPAANPKTEDADLTEEEAAEEESNDETEEEDLAGYDEMSYEELKAALPEGYKGSMKKKDILTFLKGQ